jgi:glycosyltransferase involved in cell wall biosynthesis
MSGAVGGSPVIVSIVVPAYNAAAFVDLTVDSIKQQTETRWECVIVDDGSTDGTLAVIRHATADDGRFRIIAQVNQGASAARNAGYRATNANAPWVTFMDSDDVWRPHALATLLRCAANSTGVGCHALAELVDADGRVVAPGTYPDRGRHRLALQGRYLSVLPLSAPTTFDVLINGNVLFPPGLVLARRSAYDLVGPFDEQLNGPEDWDMLIRLSRVGHFDFINDVILDYRRHGSNLGASPGVPAQAWLVRCLNYWSTENTSDQQRRAQRGWRAYQRQLRAEEMRVLSDAVRGRRWSVGTLALLRAGVFTIRGWRGFPLPRVRRRKLTW